MDNNWITMDNTKNPKKYVCNLCTFYSDNLKDYNRHCKTLKHAQSQMDNKKPQKTPKYFLCVIIVKKVTNIGQVYQNI